MLGDVPRLILVAKQDIAAQTELLYDYGDRWDRRGLDKFGMAEEKLVTTWNFWLLFTSVYFQE